MRKPAADLFDRITTFETLWWAARQAASRSRCRLDGSPRGRIAPAEPSQRQVAPIGAGDLAGARVALKEAMTRIQPDSVIAYVATYWDLFWVLDPAQQRRLVELPVGVFGGSDHGGRALAIAHTWHALGDVAKSRSYADSARTVFESDLVGDPDNPELLSLLATALAYLGRIGQAVAMARRSVELVPADINALDGPYYRYQLIRVLRLAEMSEAARAATDSLMAMPYLVTSEWLKLDPLFEQAPRRR